MVTAAAELTAVLAALCPQFIEARTIKLAAAFAPACHVMCRAGMHFRCCAKRCMPPRRCRCPPPCPLQPAHLDRAFGWEFRRLLHMMSSLETLVRTVELDQPSVVRVARAVVPFLSTRKPLELQVHARQWRWGLMWAGAGRGGVPSADRRRCRLHVVPAARHVRAGPAPPRPAARCRISHASIPSSALLLRAHGRQGWRTCTFHPPIRCCCTTARRCSDTLHPKPPARNNLLPGRIPCKTRQLAVLATSAPPSCLRRSLLACISSAMPHIICATVMPPQSRTAPACQPDLTTPTSAASVTSCKRSGPATVMCAHGIEAAEVNERQVVHAHQKSHWAAQCMQRLLGMAPLSSLALNRRRAARYTTPVTTVSSSVGASSMAAVRDDE